MLPDRPQCRAEVTGTKTVVLREFDDRIEPYLGLTGRSLDMDVRAGLLP